MRHTRPHSLLSACINLLSLKGDAELCFLRGVNEHAPVTASSSGFSWARLSKSRGNAARAASCGRCGNGSISGLLFPDWECLLSYAPHFMSRSRCPGCVKNDINHSYPPPQRYLCCFHVVYGGRGCSKLSERCAITAPSCAAHTAQGTRITIGALLGLRIKKHVLSRCYGPSAIVL